MLYISWVINMISGNEGYALRKIAIFGSPTALFNYWVVLFIPLPWQISGNGLNPLDYIKKIFYVLCEG